MSTWKVAVGAAILAVGLAPAAHADEFTKLTLLTFSGPVDVPGVSLPAGTYRFSLADPESGRRVVRVSDKDGTKTYGIFLTVPNQRMTASGKPVVMFNEAAAGAPPAVRAWFYPGETYGYEFAYPHDQALKIARATHQPVLSYNDHRAAASTDADKSASMKSAEIARIDEHDKPVSTDEALKESSEHRTPATVAPTPATRASASARNQSQTPVATTGSTAVPAPAARPARQHLPRTASQLPLLALIGSLSLLAGVGIHLARKSA